MPNYESGHFIRKCQYCSVLMGQCRCPSKNKNEIFGICKKCHDDPEFRNKVTMEASAAIEREL